MNRPYTICHILSASDGKITGEFMEMESARSVSEEYGRIRTEYQADAWLYGTITTKEFTGWRKPEPDFGTEVPDGDFVAEKQAPLYYVSVDVQGEIGWESGTFHKAGRPDAHVIEVLTEKTPAAYRAYLRKHGVSYILAGSEGLDSKLAVEKLHQLFGINTLLIAPVADGNPDSVTVFEKSPLLPAGGPAVFQLKNIERLRGDGIRLVYTVRKVIR